MTYKSKLISTILIGLILSVGGFSSATAKEKSIGADANEYEVKVKREGGKISVVTTGKGGYHCNILYPWKLTVSGGAKETVFQKADAVEFAEKAVRFSIPLTAGNKAVLKLSVCNDKQCIMKTENLTF